MFLYEIFMDNDNIEVLGTIEDKILVFFHSFFYKGRTDIDM